MILYSVVPEETILQGADEAAQNLRLVDMNVNGYDVQVQLLNERQGKIVRLYSADPNDFLNPEVAPGTIIQFR